MHTFKKIILVSLLAAVAAGMNPLTAMQQPQQVGVNELVLKQLAEARKHAAELEQKNRRLKQIIIAVSMAAAAACYFGSAAAGGALAAGNVACPRLPGGQGTRPPMPVDARFAEWGGYSFLLAIWALRNWALIQIPLLFLRG